MGFLCKDLPGLQPHRLPPGEATATTSRSFAQDHAGELEAAPPPAASAMTAAWWRCPRSARLSPAARASAAGAAAPPSSELRAELVLRLRPPRRPRSRRPGPGPPAALPVPRPLLRTPGMPRAGPWPPVPSRGPGRAPCPQQAHTHGSARPGPAAESGLGVGGARGHRQPSQRPRLHGQSSSSGLGGAGMHLPAWSARCSQNPSRMHTGALHAVSMRALCVRGVHTMECVTVRAPGCVYGVYPVCGGCRVGVWSWTCVECVWRVHRVRVYGVRTLACGVCEDVTWRACVSSVCVSTAHVYVLCVVWAVCAP